MDPRDDRPETGLPEAGQGTAPPGWYPDPAGGRGLRWWDGARWTAQVAMPTTSPAQVAQGTAPAGWYPDPAGGRGLRWWDGARWTAELAMPPTPPAQAASRDLADTDTLATSADPWAVEPSLPTGPMFGVRTTKDPNAEPSWGGVFGIQSALVLGSFLVAWILILGADGCNSGRCLDLYGRGWLLLMAAHPVLLVGCGATFLVGVFTKRVAVKRVAVWVLPIGMVAAWIAYAVMAGIALDA